MWLGTLVKRSGKSYTDKRHVQTVFICTISRRTIKYMCIIVKSALSDIQSCQERMSGHVHIGLGNDGNKSRLEILIREETFKTKNLFSRGNNIV